MTFVDLIQPRKSCFLDWPIRSQGLHQICLGNRFFKPQLAPWDWAL